MDLQTIWSIVTSDEAAKGLGFTLALLMRADAKKVRQEFVQMRLTIDNLAATLKSVETNHGSRLQRVEQDVEKLKESK